MACVRDDTRRVREATRPLPLLGYGKLFVGEEFPPSTENRPPTDHPASMLRVSTSCGQMFASRVCVCCT